MLEGIDITCTIVTHIITPNFYSLKLIFSLETSEVAKENFCDWTKILSLTIKIWRYTVHGIAQFQ
jgi:hypothetical protein